jgi:hypothetical protein
MLSPVQRLHFAAWEEHIDKNFNDIETVRLQAILDVICREVDGETEVTVLTRLSAEGEVIKPSEMRSFLQTLQTDGFLERAGNRWAFRSGLLRRYWLEYMAHD